MTRSFFIFIVLYFLLGLPGCSEDDPTSPRETIRTPDVPSGCDSTAVNSDEIFTVSGAASSKGHDLDYRLDWGDGNVTMWDYAAEASHTWSTEGMYGVKAQARCATHTDAVSAWSGERMVAVGEAISTPTKPGGSVQLDIGVIEIYATGGARSSMGHDLEYRFDWGDGNQSPWSSSSNASHSWETEGNYMVTAQARCALHPARTSSWSQGLLVEAGETVSIPPPPEGHSIVTVNRFEVYCTGGANSSRGHPVLYQFDWGGTSSPLWTSANCASIYWPQVGNFTVRVRARCAEHAEAISDWSEPLSVLISNYELIATPDIPSGPANTHIGITDIYSVSGAYSSSGHNIEFQFDWGDDSRSPWSFSSHASHSWSNEDRYVVSVRARCIIHTANISSWSEGLSVTVDP